MSTKTKIIGSRKDNPIRSDQLPKAPWLKVPKTPKPAQKPVKKGKKGK